MAKNIEPPKTTSQDPSLMHPSSKFIQTACIKKSEMPVGIIQYLNTTVQPPTVIEGYSEMKLEKTQQTYRLDMIEQSTIFNDHQAADLHKLYGIDLKEQMKHTLASEDKQNLERNLVKNYLELGEISKNEIRTPRQKFFAKYFKKLTFPNFVYAQQEHDMCRFLIAKILMGSNMIATRSRRGSAQFIVTNGQLAAFLQDSSSFVVENSGSVELSAGGIYPVGQIAGITVFTDPYLKWNENTVVLGRTTNDNDTGTYLVEGERKCEEIEMSIDFSGSQSKKLSLRTRRTIVATKGAEKNYLSLDIEFKKKPWWRKLLGI